MELIADLLRGLFDGLRPVRRLTVDDWSDENVRLTSENSAEPGPFRTSRMPFLRQIMRDLSPTSPVTEVRVQKGVQLGFTTSALNVAGCFIDIDPCPIMYIMPTIELAESISKDRFVPMVENSPALTKRIKPARERDSGNTIRAKQFPGGRLTFSGANSAASLRSRPVRVLLADEVDAFPYDADGEGSPLSLAEKRQATFGDRKKIYKLSTPTIKGASVIEYEVDRTGKRKFFLPCPHCAAAQALEFERLKWDEGKPETVAYICEHCDEPIHERHKTWMLERGEWLATQPDKENGRIVGYLINSLYSPLGMLSWADVAAEWEKAQGDEALTKAFVNSILGQTYEQAGDAPEHMRLYQRRQTYDRSELPSADIAFLTAGADIQRDRIEVEVVGWCPGRVSYSIDYRVLDGDTTKPAVWDKLAAIVGEVWRRPDGAMLPLRMMAVDSGFNTTEVYNFCKRFDTSRVVPTKGDDALTTAIGTPRQIHIARSGKKIGSTRVWSVGVNVLKTELYGWLRLEPNEDETLPPGFCFFPEYDLHYFKMLTAERMQLVADKRGFPKPTWILPAHARNEALDCRVYARAAAAVVGMDRFKDADWETFAQSYGYGAGDAASTSPTKPRRGPRESIWEGREFAGDRGSIWNR